MRPFPFFRVVAILIGAITIAKLAQTGFDLLLDDVFKVIIETTNDWVRFGLVWFDPLVNWSIEIIRQLDIPVPELLGHWRLIFVLLLLCFSAYVRETAASHSTARSAILGAWAFAVALATGVAAGVNTYESVQIFFWPLAGLFLFFLGAHTLDALASRDLGLGRLRAFGIWGLILLAGAVASTAWAVEWVDPVQLKDINARAFDLVASPGLLGLIVVVVLLGFLLTVFGLPRTSSALPLNGNPGRSIGLSILAAFSTAAVGLYASQIERASAPRDLSVEPKMVVFQTPVAGGMVKKYSLSVAEVTWAEFNRFVQEEDYHVKGSCTSSTTISGQAQADGSRTNWVKPFPAGTSYDKSRPVVCISHSDARAYANWLKERTGKYYRLPTQEEWRSALSGDTAPGRRLLKCDRCDMLKTPGTEPPLPVMQTGDIPSGLYGMKGNVWEWTDTCVSTLDAVGSDTSRWSWNLEVGGCAFRVVESGFMEPGTVWGLPASARHNLIGFRVARTD